MKATELLALDREGVKGSLALACTLALACKQGIVEINFFVALMYLEETGFLIKSEALNDLIVGLVGDMGRNAVKLKKAVPQQDHQIDQLVVNQKNQLEHCVKNSKSPACLHVDKP
ncbi:hypothetical protein L7G72_06600 [Xenorhabdus bovienii]|uniref:hypothetical protein n=1 Tax=Xenorhabdus bovienii TaxID=40576 RepID=UPI001EE05D87|nr:hypothetical protein [Xenorhabdus bovienii]MCG3461526.1 hypothetical protein [Xenorhabdus bovienii]